MVAELISLQITHQGTQRNADQNHDCVSCCHSVTLQNQVYAMFLITNIRRVKGNNREMTKYQIICEYHIKGSSSDSQPLNVPEYIYMHAGIPATIRCLYL